MAVLKNEKTGKWEVRTYYKDFTGTLKQKTKRGFDRKSDAIDWERSFKLQQDENLDMYFKDFVEIYIRDKKPRVKYNTWLTKESIIEKKIMPYFEKKKLSEIRTSDILQWQNEMMKLQTKDGKRYSQTYLKTIHNQLSAILNHAVNMYGLRVNVARRAGNMGREEKKEMLFWTQDEYQTFVEAVADKEESYIAFEILYWCGIRLGELLALTPADFDFDNNKLRINKSFQRLKGKDVITTPKTPKSNRVIYMPEFLALEVKDYITRLYGIRDYDRMFQISKTFLHHEMDRGVKLSGVKRIRIHDLRHSHVSLLINMGYSALAIGDRVGHEAIAITYRYAHLFPSIQSEMAMDLDKERTSLVGFEPKADRRKAGLANVSEKEGREESLEKSYNRFQVISGRRNRA
ncbi:site-specific integrase [Butyrivibrio sp. M55]|uniref:site-specific integrase n=1 Tax=Butyrivibrio sp. M55 TaxID=1855323 RepID=UPI0008EF4FCC|nr:site-specific integrase [Butyrivibrio sp. M55]SFU51321.1 AP2-like DNA-binding integrase domain-containing protein [Butyrivibrio sp. M55]